MDMNYYEYLVCYDEPKWGGYCIVVRVRTLSRSEGREIQRFCSGFGLGFLLVSISTLLLVWAKAISLIPGTGFTWGWWSIWCFASAKAAGKNIEGNGM